MILRQFLHSDPVGISYLFGCGGQAAGAVVDPVGDIEPYLRAADDAGMRIHFVIDTHVHADHLSAGRALAERGRRRVCALGGGGCVVSLSRACATATCFRSAMSSAKVLHTPGHTPEHICILVTRSHPGR